MPETASPATPPLCWDLARNSAHFDREWSIKSGSERPKGLDALIALRSCSPGITAENSKTQTIHFSGLRAARGEHT